MLPRANLVAPSTITKSDAPIVSIKTTAATEIALHNHALTPLPLSSQAPRTLQPLKNVKRIVPPSAVQIDSGNESSSSSGAAASVIEEKSSSAASAASSSVAAESKVKNPLLQHMLAVMRAKQEDKAFGNKSNENATVSGSAGSSTNSSDSAAADIDQLTHLFTQARTTVLLVAHEYKSSLAQGDEAVKQRASEKLSAMLRTYYAFIHHAKTNKYIGEMNAEITADVKCASVVELADRFDALVSQR